MDRVARVFLPDDENIFNCWNYTQKKISALQLITRDNSQYWKSKLKTRRAEQTQCNSGLSESERICT